MTGQEQQPSEKAALTDAEWETLQDAFVASNRREVEEEFDAPIIAAIERIIAERVADERGREAREHLARISHGVRWPLAPSIPSAEHVHQCAFPHHKPSTSCICAGCGVRFDRTALNIPSEGTTR